MWRTIETAGVTVIVAAFVKSIVIDILGNILSDRVEQLLSRKHRSRILFVHGFEHVQKTPYHQPRSPLKCTDGECVILRSAQALPRRQRLQ